MRRHVIDAWFPHTVDTEAGGFLCDFDRKWRRRGTQRRLLEFQARQTRTAARLGMAFPSESRWPEWALHGLRYINSTMRDQEGGGWYWMVERDGTPGHGSTKHSHGLAYLLGAGVLAYQLTNDPEALELADGVFRYLEEHAYDPEGGGYYGWMLRDGRPILTRADLPDESLAEPLGTGLGLKDLNTHTDLLQSLTLYCEVTDDPRALQRLAEVYDLIDKRHTTSSGAMHFMVEADGAPVPAPERYGYQFQAPPRLIDAAPLIGRSCDETTELVQRMVNHAFERAVHPRGGFIEAGPGDAPDALGVYSLRSAERPWWVQTEALRTLVQLTASQVEPKRYGERADWLRGVIDRDLLDHRYGGWFMGADDWRNAWQKPFQERPKVGVWKDASHEADLYLTALRILRGLGPNASLESD